MPVTLADGMADACYSGRDRRSEIPISDFRFPVTGPPLAEIGKSDFQFPISGHRATHAWQRSKIEQPIGALGKNQTLKI